MPTATSPRLPAFAKRSDARGVDCRLPKPRPTPTDLNWQQIGDIFIRARNACSTHIDEQIKLLSSALESLSDTATNQPPADKIDNLVTLYLLLEHGGHVNSQSKTFTPQPQSLGDMLDALDLPSDHNYRTTLNHAWKTFAADSSLQKLKADNPKVCDIFHQPDVVAALLCQPEDSVLLPTHPLPRQRLADKSVKSLIDDSAASLSTLTENSVIGIWGKEIKVLSHLSELAGEVSTAPLGRRSRNGQDSATELRSTAFKAPASLESAHEKINFSIETLSSSELFGKEAATNESAINNFYNSLQKMFGPSATPIAGASVPDKKSAMKYLLAKTLANVTSHRIDLANTVLLSLQGTNIAYTIRQALDSQTGTTAADSACQETPTLVWQAIEQLSNLSFGEDILQVCQLYTAVTDPGLATIPEETELLVANEDAQASRKRQDALSLFFKAHNLLNHQSRQNLTPSLQIMSVQNKPSAERTLLEHALLLAAHDIDGRSQADNPEYGWTLGMLRNGLLAADKQHLEEVQYLLSHPSRTMPNGDDSLLTPTASWLRSHYLGTVRPYDDRSPFEALTRGLQGAERPLYSAREEAYEQAMGETADAWCQYFTENPVMANSLQTIRRASLHAAAAARAGQPSPPNPLAGVAGDRRAAEKIAQALERGLSIKQMQTDAKKLKIKLDDHAQLKAAMTRAQEAKNGKNTRIKKPALNSETIAPTLQTLVNGLEIGSQLTLSSGGAKGFEVPAINLLGILVSPFFKITPELRAARERQQRFVVGMRPGYSEIVIGKKKTSVLTGGINVGLGPSLGDIVGVGIDAGIVAGQDKTALDGIVLRLPHGDGLDITAIRQRLGELLDLLVPKEGGLADDPHMLKTLFSRFPELSIGIHDDESQQSAKVQGSISAGAFLKLLDNRQNPKLRARAKAEYEPKIRAASHEAIGAVQINRSSVGRSLKGSVHLEGNTSLYTERGTASKQANALLPDVTFTSKVFKSAQSYELQHVLDDRAISTNSYYQVNHGNLSSLRASIEANTGAWLGARAADVSEADARQALEAFFKGFTEPRAKYTFSERYCLSKAKALEANFLRDASTIHKAAGDPANQAQAAVFDELLQTLLDSPSSYQPHSLHITKTCSEGSSKGLRMVAQRQHIKQVVGTHVYQVLDMTTLRSRKEAEPAEPGNLEQ
ncbi:MAG: hypothetical protein ACK5NY_04935 [Burkholderiaceae bacterium]